MAFCPQCGTPMQADFRFCPGCGRACTISTESGQTPFSETETVEHASQHQVATQTLVAPQSYPWTANVQAMASRYKDPGEFYRSDEWVLKPQPRSGTRPGPVPPMIANTPLAQAVFLALVAKRDYENFDPVAYAPNADSLQLRLYFADENRHDLDVWKIVLDPDGERIHPYIVLPEISYEISSGSGYYWHTLFARFNGFDLYSSGRRDLDIALVRGILGEVRYTLPSTMP